MENYVDKEFEDLLESVESVNDQFIQNFYNDEEIQEESDIFEENIEQNEPVEKNEENVEEILIPQTKPVENLIFSTSDLDETDLNSLMSSPIELEINEWTEPAHEEFIENPIEIEEIKFEEPNLEPMENSVDDILKILDKSKNSEDFFEKLEEKLND